MQNREVPLGSLPIFFSSRQRAEAGRTCPEVRGGEAGRGTRATVRGTQKTEPRARARGAGRGVQDAGRRTQNAERRTRATGRGQQNTGNGGTKCRRRKTRARGAGRRTRATGRGQQNTGNAGTGRRRRGTSPRAWNATRPHTPRQAPQQPAWTVHSRAPSAAGTNPPGPFTAGRPPPGPATTRRGHSQPGAIRHRDLQQPAGAVHSRAPSAAGRRYLSRVRIRITPLPPRTPYMLLPRCTSTDLTS